MTEQQDEVMAEITTVVAHGGDAAGATERFAELWDRVGPSGDPLHRCALAHYAADVQTDLNEELRWDLRALEAAREITDSPSRPSRHRREASAESATARGLCKIIDLTQTRPDVPRPA